MSGRTRPRRQPLTRREVLTAIADSGVYLDGRGLVARWAFCAYGRRFDNLGALLRKLVAEGLVNPPGGESSHYRLTEAGRAALGETREGDVFAPDLADRHA